MNNETPTTKRFPRSLSEAFPAERAHAIEHYKRRPVWKKLSFLTALAAFLWTLAWLLCSR